MVHSQRGDAALCRVIGQSFAMDCVSLAPAPPAGYGAAMNETVRISVPVSPEAAVALADEDSLREVGQLVSALVLRASSPGQGTAADSFMRLLLGNTGRDCGIRPHRRRD